MIGRLRQLSEPRLRQQAGIEKSLTSVERDILVQWVRKNSITMVCPPVQEIIYSLWPGTGGRTTIIQSTLVISKIRSFLKHFEISVLLHIKFSDLGNIRSYIHVIRLL